MGSYKSVEHGKLSRFFNGCFCLFVCLFESFERSLLENFFENSGARGDNLRHYHVISMVPSVIHHLSSRPIRA